MSNKFLSGRLWEVAEPDLEKVERLATRFGFSKTLSRFFALRDIEEEGLEDFLNPKMRNLMPDPSVLADMDKAVEVTIQALRTGEKIAIYGDYDVDGITTAALLKVYFDALGVESETFLPDRMLDGYGLNINRLKEIEEQGFSFLITVDCGAKDIKALNFAAEAGIRVVILDHHPTDEMPPAAAFVNPNGAHDTSGLGTLTAGGVAFMFLIAMNRALKKTHKVPDLMQFLDFVALSTVCDVASLTGLNRAFVVRGLELLAQKSNRGLAALADKAGMRGRPNVESFSFGLGPRINAAGRIGKAEVALALLTSKNQEEADYLAAQLNTLNRQRQAMEKVMLTEAHTQVEEPKTMNSTAVVVASDGWHAGIIGIIAARLKDRYERTAIVIALHDDTGTGSIRGDGLLDLGALMEEAVGRELLIRGGGHHRAAGFTIARDKVEAFRAFFMKASDAYKTNQPACGQIDSVLDFSAATGALYEDLQKAAPFGKGIAAPCLLFTDGRLMHSRLSGNGHLRCTFRPSGGGGAVEVVGFFQANTRLGLQLQAGTGELFHIIGTLRPAWNRRVSAVEIALEDAIPAAALAATASAAATVVATASASAAAAAE